MSLQQAFRQIWQKLKHECIYLFVNAHRYFQCIIFIQKTIPTSQKWKSFFHQIDGKFIAQIKIKRLSRRVGENMSFVGRHYQRMFRFNVSSIDVQIIYLRHSFSLAKRMYKFRRSVVNDIEIWTVKMFSRQDDRKWYVISIVSFFEFKSKEFEIYDIATLSNAKTMQTALICHARWNSVL